MGTLAQALRQAAMQGLERLDAQMLLLHALQRQAGDRAWLMAHDADPLTPATEAVFNTLSARRLQGEPVAYLLGSKEFFGLALKVDERVLVPRPDTETLVDWALELLPEAAACKVLDLGTGSGAIALAIARNRTAAAVDAVDASEDALAVARCNARTLGLPVNFFTGHWLDGAPPARTYDLVVSNPPYIAADDEHLPALRHEPLQALVSGADGLGDLRIIVATAPARLAAGGWLLLEHGWNQAGPVRALLAAAGLEEVQSRTDLGGNERCSGGRRPQRG